MKTIRNPFIRRASLASTLTALSRCQRYSPPIYMDNGAPTGNWNTTDANWTRLHMEQYQSGQCGF